MHMADPILLFTGEELRRAGAMMNPLDILAEELVARGGPGAAAYRCTLTPWTPADAGTDAGDVTETLVLCELSGTGDRSLMPAEMLRLLGAAALTALAVRELLGPGLITACVLGSGLAAEVQLATNAQHAPDISHVAVWPGGTAEAAPLDPRVLDQLELAGARLTSTASVGQALFGANLVIVTEDVGDAPAGTHLAKGALVVNAAGTELPAGFADGAQVHLVDDARLLTGVPDPQMYLDLGATAAGGHDARPVDADLGQVLTGLHRGRPHLDAIVVVELLSAGLLILPLAGRLHQLARRLGLGRPVG
ncbi:hypothetical protein GCM10009827_080190 [Dactylosporangium maewongense]|uniref:Ornithine cyclodeaminase n=2 Tax=Micromonosporaceae TaxID=28056 RepID=A0ABN2BXI5_9ACTN